MNTDQSAAHHAFFDSMFVCAVSESIAFPLRVLRASVVNYAQENCKVRYEGVRSMFSVDDFAVSLANWPKNGPDPDFAVLLQLCLFVLCSPRRNRQRPFHQYADQVRSIFRCSAPVGDGLGRLFRQFACLLKRLVVNRPARQPFGCGRRVNRRWRDSA